MDRNAIALASRPHRFRLQYRVGERLRRRRGRQYAGRCGLHLPQERSGTMGVRKYRRRGPRNARRQRLSRRKGGDGRPLCRHRQTRSEFRTSTRTAVRISARREWPMVPSRRVARRPDTSGPRRGQRRERRISNARRRHGRLYGRTCWRLDLPREQSGCVVDLGQRAAARRPHVPVHRRIASRPQHVARSREPRSVTARRWRSGRRVRLRDGVYPTGRFRSVRAGSEVSGERCAHQPRSRPQHVLPRRHVGCNGR